MHAIGNNDNWIAKEYRLLSKFIRDTLLDYAYDAYVIRLAADINSLPNRPYIRLHEYLDSHHICPMAFLASETYF